MSDTPDRTQEGVKRFDVVGVDWETLECGLGEYVLFSNAAVFMFGALLFVIWYQ